MLKRTKKGQRSGKKWQIQKTECLVFSIFKFVTFLVLEKTFRKIRNCSVISENQKSFRKVIVLNLLDFSHLLVVHDGVHVNQSINRWEYKEISISEEHVLQYKGEVSENFWNSC